MFTHIHPCKGNLGVVINAGKDVPLQAIPEYHNGVCLYQESLSWLSFELGDALFWLVSCPFLSQFLCLSWMPVELVFLNDSLHFPGRDEFLVVLFVEHLELLLAITDMRSSKSKDAKLLFSGNLPLSGSPGSSGPLFQRLETPGIVLLLPSMEGLPGDAKVPAGLRYILALLVVVHPLETFLRFS